MTEQVKPEPGDALVGQWYVRTAENAVYGPARFAELAVWAAEARIVPGCMVSCDGTTWFPAETVERLRMEWTLSMPGSETIGPLSLLAISDLFRDGAVPFGTALTHRSGKTTRIDEHFFELVVSEARETLAAFVLEEATIIDTARKRLAEAVAKAQTEFALEAKNIESSKEELRRRCEAAENTVRETTEALQATRKTFETLTVQAAELSTAGEKQSQYLKELETAQDTLQKRCETAEGSARESMEALAAARQEIQSLNATIESLRKMAGEPAIYIQKLEAEQEEWRRRCETAEQAVRDSSETLQATRAEAKALATKAEALSAAGERYLQHVKTLESTNGSLRQRLAEVQAAADESEKKLDETRRTLQEARDALQVMTAKAGETERRENERIEECARLSAALEEQREREKRFIEQQHAREIELRETINALTRTLETCSVEMDQMRSTVAEVNRRISDLEARNAASAREIEALTLQRDSIQGDFHEYRNRSEEEAKQREHRIAEMEKEILLREKEVSHHAERLAEMERQARFLADEYRAAKEQWQRENDDLSTRLSQEHHEAANLRMQQARIEQEFAQLNDTLQRERDEARLERVKQDAIIQQTRDSLDALTHREEQLTREKNELLRRLQTTEAELRSEIESLDRETTMLSELLDQVRPPADAPLPSKPVARRHINWMDSSPDKKAGIKPPVKAGGDEDRWVNHLRSTSAMLRRAEKELEKQQQLYHDLEVRSRAREDELNGMMNQLKRDLETSAALVRQLMNEIERREADLRALRQTADAREKELLSRLETAERVHVVEPEVLPPEPSGKDANNGKKAGEPDKGGGKPHHILAGLEAQAQVELQAWHKQQRKTESESGASKLKNWLRRSKT